MAEAAFGLKLRKTPGAKRGSMMRVMGPAAGKMELHGSQSSLDISHSHNSNNSINTVRSSRRGSASFHMFKDLESKQEHQKLKLASFLRELEKLAKEDTKEKVRDSLAQKNNGKGASTATLPGGNDGSLSLKDIDLASLTPAQAQEKIQALHAGERMDSDSLIKLTQAAVAVMSQEETVVDLRENHPNLSKVTVVGDLHGSLNCLMTVLNLVQIDKINDRNVLVFDGDFVDRGQHSLEVLSTLLLLKLAHPENVILLRGNHEDTMTASTYGFREEIDDKYGFEKADDIWSEFGLLFAAFPIIARTNTAAIMHGGIPDYDFELEDVNKISKEIRCELKTISDPYDDDERLVQGVLWSDPSEEEGINLSDRGAGYTFGPDISKDFLERHDLKYIIRAHEPFEEGYFHHHEDIGDGMGVVTIFSTANYPCGEGENMGAVLHLDDKKGTYETKSFIHIEREGPDAKAYEAFLTSVVDDNKSLLTRAFRGKQNTSGFVTTEQWAEIIADILDLPDVPWLELQPDLAPTTKPNGMLVDWRNFLERFSTRMPKTDLLDKDQLGCLHEHRNKFLSIFQLLDTDGNGTISQKEFASGVKMLNEQLPKGQPKIQDAKKLFQAYDTDSDGAISIDDFCRALEESATLKAVTESLDTHQVESLQENHDMLHMAFKYLDTDHSGAIDRQEFMKGVELLNKRLPERSKLTDPQELFSLLDVDGNGEIDMNEFNQMFRVI